eukprot:1151054-Pelagomonas_calceolata.AAC.1
MSVTTFNGTSGRDTTLSSVSAVKLSAKVNMAHSLSPWTLAVGKSTKNRAFKSLRTFLKIFDRSFPNGTPPSARHQSRPDAVSVRPIRGRATHFDPQMIPAHDIDIHLKELKYCPDTKPLPKLQTNLAQHAGAISRLRTQTTR